ncbi:hypothetical protein ACFUGD_30105 [Streptomyces sp. NPDC057217]|uniref:hypothetical protein n=1 Tax=Streptomyces sp. NPDC057217 TaxID=3346054 RepID=UPI003642BB79
MRRTRTSFLARRRAIRSWRRITAGSPVAPDETGAVVPVGVERAARSRWTTGYGPLAAACTDTESVTASG